MFAQIPHVNNPDDIVDTIEAMRMQEEHGYKTEDYLHQLEHEQAEADFLFEQSPVDADCRSKMVEWSYQIVDFCKFRRETVAISMSMLDRFLQTPGAGRLALLDRKLFQLAAMACWYTAVKIHEPEAIEPKTISDLSRGSFTEQQVKDMESTILGAIGWRVNPPTPLAFVRHLMELLQQQPEEQRTISELAKFQTELAVNDYSFVGINASTIALAAISNALHSSSCRSEQDVRMMETALGRIAKTEMKSDVMEQSKAVLMNLVQTSSRPLPTSALTPKTRQTSKTVNSGEVHVSPRCVATSQS